MALADALHSLLRLPGATYACVVERDSGRVLAEVGRGDGAAGDGEGVVPYSVARWGTAVAAMFDATSGDELDDVMITGRRSYHLVRPVAAGSAVLAYLRLDRRRANLAAARRELAAARWGAGGPPAAPSTPARTPSPSSSSSPASAPAPASTPTPAPDPSAGASPTGPRPPAAFPGRRAAVPVGAGPTPGSTVPGPPAGGGPRIPLARRTPTRPPAGATRRPAVAPAPAEVPAGLGPPAVVNQQWVRDPSTLRRLIAGLRRMS